MSTSPTTHPPPDRLVAAASGRLRPEQTEDILRHLEHCKACRLTLNATLPRGTKDDLAEGPVTATDARPPHPGGALSSVLSPIPAPLREHPRYRIIAKLGAGGMGTVFKAEHRVMKRTVALKVVAPTLVADARTVERFHREVEVAAMLSHPNIVTAHDAEQADDVHFLVMEYIEGTDLADLVRLRGPLPVAEACDYVRQASLGLQYAFERGTVHRDIKPHNLMRAADGRVKILDFGLARFASESGPVDGLTRENAMMGTPDYLPPEQAEDSHRADIRADIYSLGCTLYYLLAGRPPFAEVGTAMQKILAHMHEPARPLDEVRADVPAELGRVVERMMAKAPGQRLQTPGEVAAALAPFLTTTSECDQSTGSQQPSPPALSKPGDTLHLGEPASSSTDRRSLSGPVSLDRRRQRGLAIMATALTLLMGGLWLALSRNHAGDDGGSPSSVALPTRRPLSPADQERAAAEWVYEVGGRTAVFVGDDIKEIPRREDLPEQKFQIAAVYLRANKHCNSYALANLEGLTRLKYLSVSRSAVGDEGLKHLSGLTTLTVLALQEAQITDEGMKSLESLTHVTELYLGGNKITDDGVASLRWMTEMRQLQLDNTLVSDKGLTHLKDMKFVYNLWLNGTQVTDNGLGALAHMPLDRLELSNTKVSDASIKTISMWGAFSI